MASLPLGNHAARETSSPSLHNPITQPGAPLAFTSGNVNVAVAELPSTLNHATLHRPSRPVVITRDSTEVGFFELCDQKHARAYFNLDVGFKKGDRVARTYAKAVKYLQLDADEQLAFVQCRSLYEYRRGFRAKQIFYKAAKYLQLAADQGHATAQYNLGVMYKTGCGIKKSDAKALEYFHLTANQGDANAQHMLGQMYDTELHGKKNYAEAIKYHQLAADQGHAYAQYDLGCKYEKGRGVERNYEKAVNYYQLAAEGGNSSAQYCLGKLYRDGKGVPLDAEKALRYFWKCRQSQNVINLSKLGITDNLLQHLPRMFEEFGGYGQIKGLTPIIELDLSCNPITDISAPFIALILKHTHTLTELSLKQTGITDQGKKPIFDALSNYNVSIVSCAIATSMWAPIQLGQATLQNRAIKIIMDELDANYPTSTPKPFDILPMEVVRQLLQTIAVVSTKNPASFYQSIVTSVSSVLGYKHATTEQVMSEVYYILMSDFSSASHKGE